jgi:hypothetical protein
LERFAKVAKHALDIVGFNNQGLELESSPMVLQPLLGVAFAFQNIYLEGASFTLHLAQGN